MWLLDCPCAPRAITWPSSDQIVKQQIGFRRQPSRRCRKMSRPCLSSSIFCGEQSSFPLVLKSRWATTHQQDRQSGQVRRVR
jgi:hypothetical protein